MALTSKMGANKPQDSCGLQFETYRGIMQIFRLSLTKTDINLYQTHNYILTWNLHKPILYFSNITWWHSVDENLSVIV
jgi:hypothetical protein